MALPSSETNFEILPGFRSRYAKSFTRSLFLLGNNFQRVDSSVHTSPNDTNPLSDTISMEYIWNIHHSGHFIKIWGRVFLDLHRISAEMSFITFILYSIVSLSNFPSVLNLRLRYFFDFSFLFDYICKKR